MDVRVDHHPRTIRWDRIVAFEPKKEGDPGFGDKDLFVLNNELAVKTAFSINSIATDGFYIRVVRSKFLDQGIEDVPLEVRMPLCQSQFGVQYAMPPKDKVPEIKEEIRSKMIADNGVDPDENDVLRELYAYPFIEPGKHRSISYQITRKAEFETFRTRFMGAFHQWVAGLIQSNRLGNLKKGKFVNTSFADIRKVLERVQSEYEKYADLDPDARAAVATKPINLADFDASNSRRPPKRPLLSADDISPSILEFVRDNFTDLTGMYSKKDLELKEYPFGKARVVQEDTLTDKDRKNTPPTPVTTVSRVKIETDNRIRQIRGAGGVATVKDIEPRSQFIPILALRFINIPIGDSKHFTATMKTDAVRLYLNKNTLCEAITPAQAAANDFSDAEFTDDEGEVGGGGGGGGGGDSPGPAPPARMPGDAESKETPPEVQLSSPKRARGEVGDKEEAVPSAESEVSSPKRMRPNDTMGGDFDD